MDVYYIMPTPITCVAISITKYMSIINNISYIVLSPSWNSILNIEYTDIIIAFSFM